MTRSKRRLQDYMPPRIVSAGEVAHLLGCSVGTFNAKLPQLHAFGFPEYDKLLRGYDLKAIELWLDERSGIGDGEEFDPHLAKLERSLGLR